MSILARDNTQEWAKPAEGLHVAICCDVIDRGDVEGTWGVRHQVEIRWQLDEQTEDGRPMLIQRRFTLSLAEKSSLRPFLETWRGKRFTREELDGFDLERLVGAPAQLQVLYTTVGDREYANVQSCLPGRKGEPKLQIRDYIRVADRQTSEGGAQESADF